MNPVASKRALAAMAVVGLTHAVLGLPLANGQAVFPQRPVHVVVPFLAGGSVDAIARLLSDRLGARLGQNVIVENKAGAGGVVGADYVARAQPDGYTLLFTPPGPLTRNPFLLDSLPYDAQNAFEPVTLAVVVPMVLLTGPQRSGWTIAGLVKESKSNPDKLTNGSQGVGTTGHLTVALFNQATGASLTHVPYKGFPPLLVDVMAGRIDTMFVDTGNALPRIRSGSVVPIAVASQKRLSMLPDVPTLVEAGYPSVISESWYALMAPAGTPAAIRQRICNEIREVLKVPEVLQQLEKLGAEPVGNQPDELGAYVRSDYERMGVLIRSMGLSRR